MKTLKTIQGLAKAGKIISKVLFILTIIGFCGCALGIVMVAAGAEVVKIAGENLEQILIEQAQTTLGTVYASMAAAMVLCAGEAVLCKFSEIYFKRELQAGTPFTFAGAKELTRLGILAICIPLGAQIIAFIVYAIMSAVLKDVAPINIDNYGSVMLGAALLLTSLICKYGAEQAELIKEKSEAAGNETAAE